jgi:hypothetical protein
VAGGDEIVAIMNDWNPLWTGTYQGSEGESAEVEGKNSQGVFARPLTRVHARSDGLDGEVMSPLDR